VVQLSFLQPENGFLVAITGNRYYRFGVGKSYTALRLGELLDKYFTIEKVVFEPKDFKKAMKMIEDLGAPGQVVVLDEAGILVNSKNWHSFINRSIAAAMMTFRNLRGLAIAVTPALKLIDPDLRLMLHGYFECEKIVKGRVPRVRVKFFRLSWSEFYDKYFRSYLRFWDKKNNRAILLKRMTVNLPSQELIEEYEKRVSKYKSKVREMVGGYLDTETLSPEEIIEDILKNKQDLIHVYDKGRKRVFPEEIRHRYGISKDLARIIARKINEKFMRDHDQRNKS